MKEKLVSIVIVTYNFEKIILECLESVERQTYRNLEIIISDDCSKDETLKICENWKKLNKKNFKIKILSSLKNEGVTRNINKGVKIANGEWIKILAGDDLLKEDAIEKFMQYKNLKEAEIIFSKAETFKIENNIRTRGEIVPNKENEKFYMLSENEKLESLLENNNIVAPATIIRRKLLEKMNYFDERFRMVEDWPFWIKLLKNNIKFYYYPIITVYYRKSNSSISGKGVQGRINKLMYEFKKEYYEYIYKNEVKSKIKKWNKRMEILKETIIIKNNNKSCVLSQIVRFLDTRTLQKYINKL